MTTGHTIGIIAAALYAAIGLALTLHVRDRKERWWFYPVCVVILPAMYAAMGLWRLFGRKGGR